MTHIQEEDPQIRNGLRALPESSILNSDHLELLLTYDLQFDRLAFQFDSSDLEIDADS